MIRKSILAFGLTVLAATTAPAAVVTITDCVNDPHIQLLFGTETLRIDVGTDDLVIQCHLQPLPGTDRIVLDANNITIDGAAGGKLSAFSPTNAVDINAKGTFTATDTELISSNNNGEMNIDSVGDQVYDNVQIIVGSADSGGDELQITCTGTSPAPGCKITVTDSDFKGGRHMRITAVGDIEARNTFFHTNSPTDFIIIRSLNGSVCMPCDVRTMTGNEGFLIIEARCFVDLPQSKIFASENIFITSGIDGAPFGTNTCDAGTFIDLRGATVSNQAGKPGEIVITANEGNSEVLIQDAILIDEENGILDVSEINFREQLPHEGFNNIVGTPAVDE